MMHSRLEHWIFSLFLSLKRGALFLYWKVKYIKSIKTMSNVNYLYVDVHTTNILLFLFEFIH